MANDSNGDFGAFLSGFLIGGLIGAVAALMMAPQSGEETRGLIRERGIELRDRADAELGQLRAEADRIVTDARGQLDEYQVKLQKTIEEGRTKISSAVDEGKEAAKKVRKDLTKGGDSTEEPAAGA